MEGKEESKQTATNNNKAIFGEEIPKCGFVSMLFYIPDNSEDENFNNSHT